MSFYYTNEIVSIICLSQLSLQLSHIGTLSTERMNKAHNYFGIHYFIQRQNIHHRKDEQLCTITFLCLPLSCSGNSRKQSSNKDRLWWEWIAEMYMVQLGRMKQSNEFIWHVESILLCGQLCLCIACSYKVIDTKSRDGKRIFAL